jgi:hypothetical protein
MIKFKKFLEFVENDFEPISSFYVKDDLNRNIWDKDDNMKSDIREDLLEIAYDYVDFLDLEIDIKDIRLTGSLANYNWSKYSDYDVHILVDKKDISKDTELVDKYLSNSSKLWSSQHNIKINEYPVELYCEDISEEHTSSGVYSLVDDKWLTKPDKIDFKPDEYLIKKKSSRFMTIIDDIKDDLESGMPYEDVDILFKNTWKKLKDARKSGLEKDGEYSIENIVFKLLRRNGYIKKLIDLKNKYYDKQFK